jgi:hypothetical protein
VRLYAKIWPRYLAGFSVEEGEGEPSLCLLPCWSFRLRCGGWLTGKKGEGAVRLRTAKLPSWCAGGGWDE